MKNKSLTDVKKEFSPLLDENGKRYIPVSVRVEDSILSPFSPKGNPTISGEFAEFLDSQYTEMKANDQLHIDIECDTIDDEERILYEGAIRSYYKAEETRKTKELVRNNIIALIMVIIGIVVLTVSVIFYIFSHEIVGEIIDIVAWVFVWEAVDLFFLRSPTLIREKLKCKHFIGAEITYSYTQKQQNVA
ncbi:MAG: YihY/virulence factor BrkB family protein [Clostridiales bacterium]|nr:YihY/virulence factor BrkB family protein [Clostridiales bacterium]